MNNATRWRVLATVACVAVLVVGCGNGHSRSATATSGASQDASGSAAVSSGQQQSGANVGSADPSSGDTSTTLSWDQQGHVVAMPADFTVTVDKPCVHAQDTQGFTVHGGLPNQLLIYDTAYADGTDDSTTHYGTGSGRSKFDEQGNFSTSFVLAGNVPPGTAYLQVASARGQLIQARTSFDIKPPTESCP